MRAQSRRRCAGQLFPDSIAMSTPQAFLMASSPVRLTNYGVAPTDLAWTCAAIRPISTRLEPVLDLRGFDHPQLQQAAATARRRSPFISARSNSASWRTTGFQ